MAEYLNVQVDWVDATPLIASIDWLTTAVIAKHVGYEIPALQDVNILLTQRSIGTLRRVTIGAEWRYDIHELAMPFERWIRILRRERWSIEESYWYEGQRFTGDWSFDGVGGLQVGTTMPESAGKANWRTSTSLKASSWTMSIWQNLP